MLLFLTGLMASGKSYWSKHLSAYLGWKAIDLDKLIEIKTGKSIKEIFNVEGEKAFRLTEASLLRDLPVQGNYVIATGGGSPCFHANMEWMNAHGYTLWLDIPPEEIAQRLSETEKKSRPLLVKAKNGDIAAHLKMLREQRLPFYSQSKFILRKSNPVMEDFMPVLNRLKQSNEG